ncbi:MAG: hypothetical protein IJ695_08625 [Butyrivibrio sp.]|nr:hypothetical protein [Butyrivibrio sp.]
MGKKDTISKDYLDQNIIFADAFNYYCYGREKVIKPEDLMELDPTELAVIRKKMNRLITNKKMRDILRNCSELT